MRHAQRVLVVGAGSIARRHIRNLKQLFPETMVGCVSASGKKMMDSEVDADIIYASMADVFNDEFDFAIVASPAPFHLKHASPLLIQDIPVLIEKPLSDCLATVKTFEVLLMAQQSRIDIGYNLRYLSSAIYLKTQLDQQLLGKIQHIRIEVGQYLPQWRPQSDYRQNVSAQQALGGGVLLELSHELDYLTWLFGPFDEVFCTTRNTGLLEIDVEDVADAIFTRADGVVANIHMDFLEHQATRCCKIVGALGTLFWDLITQRVWFTEHAGTSRLLFEATNQDRNEMYLEELRHFAKVAKGQTSPTVHISQGIYLLEMIEAMKKSAHQQQQITIKRGVS